jgi:hypothetical protein
LSAALERFPFSIARFLVVTVALASGVGALATAAGAEVDGSRMDFGLCVGGKVRTAVEVPPGPPCKSGSPAILWDNGRKQSERAPFGERLAIYVHTQTVLPGQAGGPSSPGIGRAFNAIVTGPGDYRSSFSWPGPSNPASSVVEFPIKTPVAPGTYTVRVDAPAGSFQDQSGTHVQPEIAGTATFTVSPPSPSPAVSTTPSALPSGASVIPATAAARRHPRSARPIAVGATLGVLALLAGGFLLLRQPGPRRAPTKDRGDRRQEQIHRFVPEPGACAACRSHAAHRRYRRRDAAERDRAHPGCHCQILPSPAEPAMAGRFAGRDVIDDRQI